MIEDAIGGNIDHSINFIQYSQDNNNKHLILKALPFQSDVDQNQIMLYIEDITETVELNSKLEDQYLNMFKSFVKFIDAKDTYTGLHSSNVSEYVKLILDQMDIRGYTAEEIIVALNCI